MGVSSISPRMSLRFRLRRDVIPPNNGASSPAGNKPLSSSENKPQSRQESKARNSIPVGFHLGGCEGPVFRQRLEAFLRVAEGVGWSPHCRLVPSRRDIL